MYQVLERFPAMAELARAHVGEPPVGLDELVAGGPVAGGAVADEQLVELGVRPAGLTAGQLRVLELLVRGMSNGAIAKELRLSPRTVDHHVSAILAKLEVATRAEAIAAAHARRIVG